MQIESEPLGTPPLNLNVRRCTKCNRWCYYFNEKCYICEESKL